MFSRKIIVDRLTKVLDVRRIYRRIRSSVAANPIFYVMISVYVVVMSTITILKNATFLTSGFDLGLLNQAFSTTLFDGKLFYETGDLSFNPGGSFFGVHFSPILFLLLPFYAIFPSAGNLLVMQTVILAVGAFPVYWMSRDKLSKNSGLAVVLVYFIYPPLFLLNLNDFHLEAFTSTFFLFSLYYFDKEEWRKSLVFFILSMTTLEFAPIIGVFMAFYGVVLLLRKKIEDKRGAIKYLAVALLVSLLTFAVAVKTKEAFNPSTSPLPSAFHHILTDPMGVVKVISESQDDKSLFFILSFGSLAFVPFLAPEPLIMAAPWIFASFSTSYSPYYSVYFQYTGFVIPFIFAALPTAIKRLKLQQNRRIFYLFFLSIILTSLYITGAQEAPWNTALPVVSERTELINQFVALIPSNASILTQNDIFPHVSNRVNAYMYIPKGSDITVEYIFVDINSPWYDWEQPEQFGEREPPSKKVIEGLNSTMNYGVFASAGSLLLLKKGYNSEPALFLPFDEKFNYETLFLYSNATGRTNSDSTSTSGTVLYHNNEEHVGGDFWFGPYVHLLPGLYRVTYTLKFNSNQKINQTDKLLELDVVYGGKGVDRLLNNSKIVSASSMTTAGQWFNYTLFFSVTTPAKGVEFRGKVWNPYYSISLDCVRVEQLTAQPIAQMRFYGKEMAVEQGMVSDGILTHLKGGIVTHVNGSGNFWHGPYVSLPIGDYTAKFWLKLDSNNTKENIILTDIDVATNAGKDVIKFLTLNNTNFDKVDEWQSFEIRFTLNNSKNIVELRGVNVRENAPISLRSIEVYPTNDQFVRAFNYEDLLVEQGTNSSGLLTHVAGNGTFWRGPYMSLPKGNYTAKYWLKLNRAYGGVLLDVDVATNAGKDVLEFLTLSDWNFEKIDKWQSFEIDFTLQNETNIIELRGTNVRENAPISLLAVELFKDSSPPQQTLSNRVFYSKDLPIDVGIPVRNGTFWHGPYALLDKGNYIARYWLKLDETYNGTLLDIDVTTFPATKVLTSLTVHSSNFDKVNRWKSFEIKFSINDARNIVELRGVNVRENAPISLLAVEISNDTGQLTQPLPKTVWYSQDLAIEQGTAANGTMTHTIGSGTFWHGPYALLPKGNYTARYWLKLDKAYDGILLDVDVSTDPSKDALKFLTLSGFNFQEIDKWQSFEVKFTMQNDVNIVELRGVKVRENAPISLRSIEVYPDMGQPTQSTYNVEFNYEYLVREQGVLADGAITHLTGNGTFWRGPYVSLLKGNYIAKYWLRLDRAYKGALLDIDVAADSGNKVLTSYTVHSSNFEKLGEWQSFELKFTLQNDLNIVELRGVNVRENAPISLRSVQVSSDNGQYTQPIPKTVFENEDLSIEQGTTTNGIITHTGGNGTFWNGPYASLPKGNYIAKYWLRLDKTYNGALLDIDATSNSGNKVLTSYTVHSSNFEKLGEWQSFELKFTLQNDVNIVELRGVKVRENAPISLRSIEVYPDAGQPTQLIPTVFSSVDLVVEQGITANGIITHTKGNGTFWQGPYVSLPKGDYTAKYWLKLDKTYSGILLDIDVASNSGRQLKFLALSGFNFQRTNEWQSFEIKFTLQSDVNIVEFRGVYVSENAPISLRSIEVYPDTSG